ncbi:MAG: response regulator [Bacteroidota bacterium]
MRKILLIEDNLEMRENTAEILELAGYEVSTATQGKEGVKLAQDAAFDLIICDVMMPELDGYGVLHMLSRRPETARVPFIFLTAKADKTDFRRGMNLGADDYITKPFEEVELLDAIEVRLKRSASLGKEVSRDVEGVQAFIQEARAQAALEALSESREVRYYQPKDLIFKEDGLPQYLFFLQKGKIKTYKTNEDAKEYVTGLYKDGDFIGHAAVIQGKAYGESATALEESEMLLIPTEDVMALLHQNRDVAYQFIRLLANNLLEKEEELMHLAYDTVRKRVADALLRLRERYLKEGQEAFSMSFSRDNLASMVGTAKESVIRVLSEFKQDGLIETRQSEIRILNPEGLSAIRF